MFNALKKIKNYWVSDASFVTLLVILVFTVFIMPIFIDVESDNVLFLNVIFLALFFVGIFSSGDRTFIIITSILFLLHLVLKIIRLSDLPLDFYLMERVVGILNLIVFIVINVRLLFRDDQIDVYRVIGAINVYLLLALFGSFGFEIIYFLTGSTIGGEVELYGDDRDYVSYIYYSLVSITTVGYGDIFPLNVPTKMLSVFLSAIGILYPAVIIAKLVAAASNIKHQD